MKIEFAFFLVGVFLVCAPLEAQWVKVPPAKIPRTADNKPNLSASAPRLPDGKPDLSGIWEPVNNRYVQNIAADLKPEDVPYQPWAKALFDERKTGAHSKGLYEALDRHRAVPIIGGWGSYGSHLQRKQSGFGAPAGL